MRFARPSTEVRLAGFGALTPAGQGAPPPRTARDGTPRRRDVPLDLAALCGAAGDTLRRMDRYGALGYAAAHLALRDGEALRGAPFDPGCGVMIGSSVACLGACRLFHEERRDRPPASRSPALFVRTIANAVNGDISIARGLDGPCETFVSGFTAGAEAMLAAAAAIDAGRATAVLAGGVEAPDSFWRERATESLPVEAAGFVLLRGDGDPTAPRLRAWHRSHDPAGSFPLRAAIEALAPLPIEAIVVANLVSEALLDRWRRDAGGRPVVDLAERAGELGAAAAPIAAGLHGAGARVEAGTSAPAGWLVLSRDQEGGMAVLAFEAGEGLRA